MLLSSFAAVVSFGLAFGALTGAGQAKAQVPPPIAPSAATPLSTPPRVWLVDNKQGLVTVREKDGPYLFAQVISTPTLTVEATKTTAKNTLILNLKDAKGKPLYTLRFPVVAHSEFDFQSAFTQNDKNEKSGGVSFTMKNSDGEEPTPKTDAKLVFVLDSSDWPIHGDFISGTSRSVIDVKDGQLTSTEFENEKQTGQHVVKIDAAKGAVAFLSDGNEVASLQSGGESQSSVLRDDKGEVRMQTVSHDGKNYVELFIGGRKVVMEGGNWQFSLRDGNLYLTPANSPTKTDATAGKQPAPNQ